MSGALFVRVASTHPPCTLYLLFFIFMCVGSKVFLICLFVLRTAACAWMALLDGRAGKGKGF